MVTWSASSSFWTIPFALPLLCLAQSSGAPQQQVIEELRSVRAALERLEKGQSILAALTRVQIDESRLATLEAERQRLLAEQQQITAEIDRIAPVVQQEVAANVPRLVQASPGAEPVLRSEPSPIRIRHGVATRRLEEIRTRLRTIEESAGALRQRIAAIEKSLGDEVR